LLAARDMQRFDFLPPVECEHPWHLPLLVEDR
jgi:hypothetical protein